MLTFEHDRHMHVRLQVSDVIRDRNPVSFEDLFLIDHLSLGEAADFVRTLTDWRARMLAARRGSRSDNTKDTE